VIAIIVIVKTPTKKITSGAPLLIPVEARPTDSSTIVTSTSAKMPIEKARTLILISADIDLLAPEGTLGKIPKVRSLFYDILI